MRLVGFKRSQRHLLSDFERSSDAVFLENCQVKKARLSEELEVLLKSNTSVCKSPRKFQLPASATSPDPFISVKDAVSKPVFYKVSFKAKVVTVDEPVKLAGGLTKQELTLADATAPVRLTLWQGDVNTLEVGESYAFENLMVKTFKWRSKCRNPSKVP